MRVKGVTFIGILLVILVALGVTAVVLGKGGFLQRVVPLMGVDEVENLTRVVGGDFDFDETTPGYENYLELIQGCSGKDCIPSIDKPRFESVDSADSWLKDGDVVFALEYKGEVRAYPQRILNWHEIVNDTVSDPLVITFCPLCGSALAFERVIDGQTLEFGVSGKLHNNDLVMYDRQTSSLWQQITGEAIVGEHFGKKLMQIPLSGMLWSEFKNMFSTAQVLSRDTGFSRNYDFYPYGDYESNSDPLFPVAGGVDDTIHPKTVVYGVEINGSFKAYPEEKIKVQGQIRDTIAGVNIVISYNNANIEVVREDSGEEVVATRLFWFAWKAFRPDTKLY